MLETRDKRPPQRELMTRPTNDPCLVTEVRGGGDETDQGNLFGLVLTRNDETIH